VAGSCEHSNESFGSLKAEGISQQAEHTISYQEGLCSMELVNYFTDNENE
jgi:hypothetical protein